MRNGRTDGSYNVSARIDSGASLSGNQRNRFFLNQDGRYFVDISALSAADSRADGRAWARLDYNRDGRVDLVLANANEPLCQLFKNIAPTGRMLALRFVGGNERAEPSAGWSARDGYGAEIEVTVAGKILLREHRAGEGFSAQNSATMIIGLGEYERADAVKVHWPSGRIQIAENVAAGSLLTVYERVGQSPANEAFVTTPYSVGH